MIRQKRKNKKTVLFLISSLRGGGAERVFANLLKHLDRERFNIKLGIKKKEGQLLNEIPNDVKLYAFHSAFKLLGYIKIIRFIWKERPDFVLTTLGLNLNIAILKFILPHETKIYARESNLPSEKIKHYKIPKFYKALYKYFYYKFEKIICQSEDMKKDFISEFNIKAEQLIVINNPVDYELIINKLKDAVNPYNKKRYNLVTIGRLEYQKGQDLLLSAFAKLEGDDYYLTIVGQGKKINFLKSLVEKYKLAQKVTFAGYVEYPFSFMKYADLLVLPSRYEGFPNALIEANACGTPVLAFNCQGGITEIIDEGINGWVVENGNIEAMAKKVEDILSKPALDKKRIVDITIQKYGIEKIVKKYEALFLDQ